MLRFLIRLRHPAYTVIVWNRFPGFSSRIPYLNEDQASLPRCQITSKGWHVLYCCVVTAIFFNNRLSRILFIWILGTRIPIISDYTFILRFSMRFRATPWLKNDTLGTMKRVWIKASSGMFLVYQNGVSPVFFLAGDVYCLVGDHANSSCFDRFWYHRASI